MKTAKKNQIAILITMRVLRPRRFLLGLRSRLTRVVFDDSTQLAQIFFRDEGSGGGQAGRARGGVDVDDDDEGDNEEDDEKEQ